MRKLIMVVAAVVVFLGSSSMALPETADAGCFRRVLRRAFVPARRVIRRVNPVSCSSQQVSVASEVVVEQQGYPIQPLAGRPLRVLRCVNGQCN
jgi:hypothetical protein